MTTPAPPHYTSVPPWAREPQVQPVDRTGRTFTIIEVVAPGTAAVVAGWLSTLGGRDVYRPSCTSRAEALAAVAADLAGARTGHRLLVTGTAEDCLAVRGAAVRAGLADDELRFGVVSVDTRAVWCVHCAATTTEIVELEGVVACSGCARRLLVYPHVSRRTGQHLGFMVDAEKEVGG